MGLFPLRENDPNRHCPCGFMQEEQHVKDSMEVCVTMVEDETGVEVGHWRE